MPSRVRQVIGCTSLEGLRVKLRSMQVWVIMSRFQAHGEVVESHVKKSSMHTVPDRIQEWGPGLRQGLVPSAGFAYVCLFAPCTQIVGVPLEQIASFTAVVEPLFQLPCMVGQVNRFLVGSKGSFSALASPMRWPGERDIPWSRDQKIYNGNIAWHP